MWFFLAVLAVGLLIYFKFIHNTLPKPNYLGHVPQRKHAVVVGAGIGGICAAKVLSSYFKKVTLIDRDELDFENPNPRSGVPHGGQLHSLLASGCAVADSLFPGIVDEWIENGARRSDVITEFRVMMEGAMLTEEERSRSGAGLQGINMSRPFTEFHLRRRLLSDCKNVEILTKTAALGLVYDKETNAVKGIKIRRKASQEEEEAKEKGQKGSTSIREELEADFVVCASGRKNQVKKWLHEAEVVTEDQPLSQCTCYPGLAYCNSQWMPPEGWKEKNGLKEIPNYLFMASPNSTKIGFLLFHQENGLFTILYYSYGKPHLPTKTEEIIPLVEPIVAADTTGLLKRVLPEWTQLSPWTTYHDPKNELNMFEKLGSRWPNNFVALGDTVATFNPSFGQGMSHAILHANILRESFHQHCTQFPVHDFTGLSQRFQKSASAASHNFWAVVEPNDLQWPTTEGSRTIGKTMMGVFQRHTWKVACTDRYKMWQFWNVAGGLMDPASAFFAPSFLTPVLISIGKEKWAQWQANKKGSS